MKSIIKRILPKYLITIIKGIIDAHWGCYQPFKGVILNLNDLPGKQKYNQLFFTDQHLARWSNIAVKHTSNLINQNEGKFIAPCVKVDLDLLPLLISTQEKEQSVLDWGGATGFSYLPTKFGCLKKLKKYVIIESSDCCKAGENMFDDNSLIFSENIPNEEFDIILIGSALQYAIDYEQKLRELSAVNKKWFLFTKLPAGENPTYISTTGSEYLLEKRDPMYIFNVYEIIKIMEKLGYKLVFKGAAGVLNQWKFEPKYRVERYCNLLFEK